MFSTDGIYVQYKFVYVFEKSVCAAGVGNFVVLMFHVDTKDTIWAIKFSNDLGIPCHFPSFRSIYIMIS